MSATQKYRHVTPHNGKFTFQLLIVGYPCRTSAHFDDAESAAVACDLVKHYLASEFKLVMPPCLDGEQFSCLAYSRCGVSLSDSFSVFKSLPEDVREFLTKHRAELESYRESRPPESIASKFRRSGMIEDPAIRQWVEKLEAAAMDATAFAAIDADSFFLRLKVVGSSLSTAVKSLRLALKMHSPLTNPRILARATKLKDLILHLESDVAYVTDLTAALRAEQAEVERAVATLENNRPVLT